MRAQARASSEAISTSVRASRSGSAPRPTSSLAVVRSASEVSAMPSPSVTLRTSPEAFETICQTLGGAEATVRGVQLQVLADATIPGLGCVVDGDNMRIDATVSERLRAVRRAFEEERRKTAESVE